MLVIPVLIQLVMNTDVYVELSHRNMLPIVLLERGSHVKKKREFYCSAENYEGNDRRTGNKLTKFPMVGFEPAIQGTTA